MGWLRTEFFLARTFPDLGILSLVLLFSLLQFRHRRGKRSADPDPDRGGPPLQPPTFNQAPDRKVSQAERQRQFRRPPRTAVHPLASFPADTVLATPT